MSYKNFTHYNKRKRRNREEANNEGQMHRKIIHYNTQTSLKGAVKQESGTPESKCSMVNKSSTENLGTPENSQIKLSHHNTNNPAKMRSSYQNLFLVSPPRRPSFSLVSRPNCLNFSLGSRPIDQKLSLVSLPRGLSYSSGSRPN